MKILVIEDESKVASFIKRGLEETGHEVEIAVDGKMGIEKAIKSETDFIILDINLPLVNGLDVCRKIREQKKYIPILMLTALGTINDKVTGLDSGADDYLLKPFEFKELLARIRALSRRANIEDNNTYELADLRVDTAHKTVYRGNIKIELTAKEFLLLEFLIRNQGIVLSRNEIAETVWSLSFDTGTNFIDVYINYLRKKIDKGFSPKLIHTLIGMGYVLRVEGQ